MLPSFTYVRPSTVAEAVKALSAGAARAHAGGTDLLGCLRDGVFGVDAIVSLSSLGELKGVGETAEGGLRIGALATIATVAGHAVVRARYAALAEAAALVASPQLRQQGTLGGNLCQKPRCWYYRGDFRCLRKGGDTCYAIAGENEGHSIAGGGPCYYVHPSDTAPALAALGASIHIAGPRGVRTVAVEDFFVLPSADLTRETVLEPGEIVADILLPAPAAGLRSTYRKVRARASWDFALAGAAIAVILAGDVVKDARVFLSGVAPLPWRAREVEAALAGRRLVPATITRAAAAALPKPEPLEHNGYKVPMIRGLIEERLSALAAGPAEAA
jgi:xanthine dehydrogenase YagS FAD-binding subunit